MLSGSSILITGGTGSFGHTFVPMTLQKYNPRRLVIFSRDEMKHWEMAKDYANDERVRFFVGDVRDKDRLSRALKGIDYVVHAAATKIVPTAEYKIIVKAEDNAGNISTEKAEKLSLSADIVQKEFEKNLSLLEEYISIKIYCLISFVLYPVFFKLVHWVIFLYFSTVVPHYTPKHITVRACERLPQKTYSCVSTCDRQPSSGEYDLSAKHVYAQGKYSKLC